MKTTFIWLTLYLWISSACPASPPGSAGQRRPVDGPVSSGFNLPNERGIVTAKRVSVVGPQIDGIEASFLVKVGDRVEKGQLLMEVDRRMADRLFEEARSQVFALETQLSALESVELPAREFPLRRAELEACQYLQAIEGELKVQRNLYEKNLTSQFDLETMETKRELASLALEEASFHLANFRAGEAAAKISAVRAQLQAARNRLIDLEERIGERALSAPHAGTVLLFSRPADQYSMGQSPEKDLIGAPDHKISNYLLVGEVSEVIVVLSIFQSDRHRLAVGDPVTVKADYLPGETFSGSVDEISPTSVMRANSSIFIVKAILPNPDEKLKPGTAVDVSIGGEAE